MQELQNIKRSRSKSRQTMEIAEESSSYNKEKQQRASELASLSNRKLDLDDALLFSPTELKEIALREERERELAALCARQTFATDEDLAGAAHRESLLKAERCLELAALSERNLNSFPEDTFIEEDMDNSLPANSSGVDVKVGSVRETTARWQQRQQSAGRELHTTGANTTSATPTRRIGSIF